MVLYLGIDAGGTASKARLVDANGLRLGAGKAGPANTRIGLDALHRSLPDACTQALKDGGVADSDYGSENGRAHVCTPVTNAHLVCRLRIEKTKKTNNSYEY